MKSRKYQHDYLNRWRDSKTSKYIWIQVDYSTVSFEPYHLVAEINQRRAGHIKWPLESPFGALPLDNLDFRNGSPLDFSNWHKHLSDLLSLSLTPTKHPPSWPTSYEDYIRKACLDKSSCIDIDIIEINSCAGKPIGIEGTHLKKEMYSYQEALRLFELILEKRLFRERAHQIKVQKRTMDLIGGCLWLVVYNIKEDKLDVDGNCLAINVDERFLDCLKIRSKEECCKHVSWGKFRDLYNKITGLGC